VRPLSAPTPAALARPAVRLGQSRRVHPDCREPRMIDMSCAREMLTDRHDYTIVTTIIGMARNWGWT